MLKWRRMPKTPKKPAGVVPTPKIQKKLVPGRDSGIKKTTPPAPKQLPPPPPKKSAATLKAVVVPKLPKKQSPKPTPKKQQKRKKRGAKTKPVVQQQRLVNKITIGSAMDEKTVAPFPAPMQPPTQQHAHPYAALAGMACVLAVLAVGLFTLVKVAHPPSFGALVRTFTKNMPDTIATNDTFAQWLSGWKKTEPYLSRGEFVSSASAPFTFITNAITYPNANDLQPPRANRYIWSQDKTKFVDYLSKYPNDTAVTVYGHAGTILETVEQPCGEACVVDDAFWTSSTRFVLLAHVPALKSDGSLLCVGMDTENMPRCYEKLLVASFDLDSGRRTNYLSASHFFTAHPSDATRRNRWASGLSAEEQIALGVVQPESVFSANGVLTTVSVEPTGTSLVVNQGKLGEQQVKVIAATRVRDVHGEPVSLEYLHAGFTAAITGPMTTERVLVADKIDVTVAPRVLITAPAAGATIGNSAALVGMATPDAWPLTLTVTDGTKTVATTTLAAQKKLGAAYLDLLHAMKFTRLGLKPGDKLHLQVAPAKGDGAVDFDVTYQP